MEYRAGSHSRYDIKVHLVWITKYRKKVLRGDIAKRVRELVREICLANDVVIVNGHVSVDHIHLLLSYPPTISVSKLVQYLKGKTSRKMLQEYTELRKAFWGQHLWARGYFAASVGTVTDEIVTELRKAFWGQHLWARGYFAASVGTVTDEIVKEYIEKQEIETKDDDFKISAGL